MPFELTSTAFQRGEHIPRDYTSEGRNASPPLKWTDPPSDTRSLALVVEDPDAPSGTFSHWIAFDIPAESRELMEGVPIDASLANGMKQGVNSFGGIGYGGPKPPPGKPHRYFFKLFALDRQLGLPPEATKEQLLAAMRGHVLGETELMGTYGVSRDRARPAAGAD